MNRQLTLSAQAKTKKKSAQMDRIILWSEWINFLEKKFELPTSIPDRGEEAAFGDALFAADMA